MPDWIFQGNPDRFEIDAYLQGQDEIYWTVSQPKHQKMVSTGDHVFLWRAAGKKKALRGIVGLGVISEECKPESEVKHPERLGKGHWQSSEITEVKAGISLKEVRLTPKKGMIPASVIETHPTLSEMRIITVRAGSNFQLSAEQSARLHELWSSFTDTSEVASRNPPWTRDELILALELYFDENPSHISKTHRKVVELSELLNRLSIHTDRPDAVRFRNPNGVYMKLCNYLRFDPSYSGSGLTRGGKLEEEIWNEFAENQNRLRNLAQAIEANVDYSETHETILEVDEEAEAPEGRVLFRVHRTRERNPALVKKKKKAALRKSGCLRCEVCGFDFQKVYGDLGQSFIECHHTVPVSELEPGATTKLKDLALVCANCHRMLHRGGETLTIKELRKIRR